jgi:hypothetical protein
MGYFAQLNKAAQWLVDHQNIDGGWGLSLGQGSSVVNTAESIYILAECDRFSKTNYSNHIVRGFDFIWLKLQTDLEKFPLTRYVQFAIWNVKDCHLEELDQVKQYTKWLIDAQNKDGGWGYRSADNISMLFPTVLSVITLSQFANKPIQESLEKAAQWLRSKRLGELWGFDGEENPNYVATSQGVLALTKCGHEFSIDSKRIILEYLKSNNDWSTQVENLPGTVWKHSRIMWIVPSMLLLGAEPYCSQIASAVRNANERGFEHGWKEPDGAKTIRGQFWITTMFSALLRAYDPAIVTYRIDSSFSIQKPEYQEPEFVHIRPENRIFRFVFHSGIYQFFAYLSFILSVVIVFLVPKGDLLVPRSTFVGLASLSAIIFFLVSFWLMKKRQALFPKFVRRFIPLMVSVIMCFEIISAALGYSVKDFL